MRHRIVSRRALNGGSQERLQPRRRAASFRAESLTPGSSSGFRRDAESDVSRRAQTSARRSGFSRDRIVQKPQRRNPAPTPHRPATAQATQPRPDIGPIGCSVAHQRQHTRPSPAIFRSRQRLRNPAANSLLPLAGEGAGRRMREAVASCSSPAPVEPAPFSERERRATVSLGTPIRRGIACRRRARTTRSAPRIRDARVRVTLS
jgi:hypothetical protein